jgi:hypothetical protein
MLSKILRYNRDEEVGTIEYYINMNPVTYANDLLLLTQWSHHSNIGAVCVSRRGGEENKFVETFLGALFVYIRVHGCTHAQYSVQCMFRDYLSNHHLVDTFI